VTREAVKVLEATDVCFEFIEGTVGAKAYIEYGDPLPQEEKEVCDEVDALLLGAVGQNYAPYGVPRKVLTYLRVDKNAYANVRPLKSFPGANMGPSHRFSKGVDMVIVRDNAEGFALRHYGYQWEDRGMDERVITRFGAQRISQFAFSYAVKEDRRKVSCVNQGHWLFSDRLFSKGFKSVALNYPNIRKEYFGVDVAAMMLVEDPERFDVVVSCDIHGDILSGVVIGQIGGVGMAPSACIGDDFAFFEPVHGIALDIAGRGIANPIAEILSAKLMLDWLGEKEEAEKIEAAVASVISEGEVRTLDLGGSSKTFEVGDAVVEKMGDVDSGCLRGQC
jgi:isocitrate/isopropylmalate dehydrogenase